MQLEVCKCIFARSIISLLCGPIAHCLVSYIMISSKLVVSGSDLQTSSFHLVQFFPVSGISQFLRCHSGTYDATGICFCSMNPTRQSISFLIDRCFSSYFCSDIANCNRAHIFCGKLQIARKICQHVSRRPLHIITNKHSSRGVVCTF